jgi:hypothetical protein
MRNLGSIVIALCTAVAALGQTEVVRPFNSVADLLAKARPDGVYKKVQLLGYYQPGDGGGGIIYGTNTVTSTNYGTRIFSGISGWSWERQVDGPLTVAMFGTKGDLTTDDATRAQNCFDVAAAKNLEVKIAGTFRFNTSLILTNNAIVSSFGETVNLANGDFRTFIAQDSTNVTLRGIHFTSTNGANNQTPIRFINVKDGLIENVRMDGMQLNGIEIHSSERIALRRLESYGADDFGTFIYNSIGVVIDGLKVRDARVWDFEFKDSQHCALKNFDIRGTSGHKVFVWTGEDGTTTPAPRVCSWNLIENGYIEGTTTNSQHGIFIQSSPNNTVRNVRVVNSDGLSTWSPVNVGGGNGFWNDKLAMTCNTTSGSSTVSSVSNIGQLKVGDRIRIGDVDASTSFVIQSINTGAGTFVVDKNIGTTATGKLIGWSSQSHGCTLEDVFIDGPLATGVHAILVGGSAPDDLMRGVVLTRVKVSEVGASAHGLVATYADFTMNDCRFEKLTDRTLDLRNSKVTATRLFARGGISGIVLATNSMATLIAPDMAGGGGIGVVVTPNTGDSRVSIFGGMISNYVSGGVLVNSNSVLSGVTIVGSRIGNGSSDGQVLIYGQGNAFVNNLADKGSSTFLDSHFKEQSGATLNNFLGNVFVGGLANDVILASGSTSTRWSATGASLGGGALFKKLLSATATLDFASIAANSSGTLTITVTGAATGDSVAIGLPASPTAGIVFVGYVSSANTVTITAFNVTAGAIDPASASYRATVYQF